MLHIFGNFVLCASHVKTNFVFTLIKARPHHDKFYLRDAPYRTLGKGRFVKKKTYPYWVSPCLGQLLIFTTWALLSLWSTSYKQQNSKTLVRNQKEKKTSNIAEGYMGSFKIKSLAMLLSMRDWIIWYKKKLSVRMLNVFAYLSHNFLFRQIFGKNPLA